MNIWVIGWGILSTFLQYRFLMKMLGKKYHYTFLWFYLGSLLYGQVNITFDLATTTRSNLIYNLICAFVLNMLLFYGSVIKKCFFTLWIYCIQMVIFCVLFPLVYASAIARGQNNCPDLTINIISIISSLVSFLLMEMLHRRLHVLKRDFTNQDAVYLMYIILFIYGAVDMMTELFAGIRGLTPEIAFQLAWPCSLIALGGSGLYVYCVIMLESRLLKYAAEQQYQTMDRHLETSREQYLRLARFQHDIKNHVLCLKELLGNGKDAEALRYLEQMNDHMKQEQFRVQTGSVFVDAVLNPKYSKAKKLGIDIDISMTVPSEDEIVPIDLCCLLSNALDNAIEACERRISENDTPGWIRMKTCLHKRYWVFEISNSIHVPPAMYNGKFLSSKRRQAYGVGLQNIKAVVERYKGVMETESGDHFILSVMIPRCQK